GRARESKVAAESTIKAPASDLEPTSIPRFPKRRERLLVLHRCGRPSAIGRRRAVAIPRPDARKSFSRRREIRAQLERGGPHSPTHPPIQSSTQPGWAHRVSIRWRDESKARPDRMPARSQLSSLLLRHAKPRAHSRPRRDSPDTSFPDRRGRGLQSLAPTADESVFVRFRPAAPPKFRRCDRGTSQRHIRRRCYAQTAPREGLSTMKANRRKRRLRQTQPLR